VSKKLETLGEILKNIEQEQQPLMTHCEDVRRRTADKQLTVA